MLHYQASGVGHPIVLVHGFCENSTCFNKQVLLLNLQGFCTITVDLPGFGQSKAVPDITIEGMADMLEKTLQKININKVVVLGHSMGGYITLAYAKKYQERLAGFGLLHSTAAADTDDRKSKREQSITFIKSHGVYPYVSNFVPPLFAPHYKIVEDIDAAVEQAINTTSDGLCYALQAMKDRPDSLEFISQTGLPVLYIAGEHDQIIPLDAILKQASTLQNGKLCLLKNAAHMGMIEQADTCASQIVEFTNYCFATA
jgi:pimeloyl-ACP methyl ester carboxylesterase